MAKLIGIAGRKEAGKDTAANILVEERGYTNIKFAGGIKEAAALFFEELGYDEDSIQRLVDGESKEKPQQLLIDGSIALFEAFSIDHTAELADILGITEEHFADLDLPSFTGNTSREFQQFFGTEVGRNLVGERVWIDAALIKAESVGGNVVISDVRFPNEVDAIRSAGGITNRINRAATQDGNEFSNHPSEALIDALDVDIDIDNNHTLNDLYWTILIANDEAPAAHGAVGFFTRRK